MTHIFQVCLSYEDVNDCDRMHIFIYAAAYILMHSIREMAVRGTSLERVSILTIQEKMLSLLSTPKTCM